MTHTFTAAEIARDNASWAALKEELSQPDPSLPFEFDEPEHDPFAFYRGHEIRTDIPEAEHGDVRPTDVFTWQSDHGGYYLWERGE